MSTRVRYVASAAALTAGIGAFWLWLTVARGWPW